MVEPVSADEHKPSQNDEDMVIVGQIKGAWGLRGDLKIEVLKAVLDSVQEALASGDRVVLTGFGSFEVRDVKARRVRPIRGGSAGNLITVPAHKRVGFTAGAELSKSAQG